MRHAELLYFDIAYTYIYVNVRYMLRFAPTAMKMSGDPFACAGDAFYGLCVSMRRFFFRVQLACGVGNNVATRIATRNGSLNAADGSSLA